MQPIPVMVASAIAPATLWNIPVIDPPSFQIRYDKRQKTLCLLGVCTENLNPGVVVMKSAKDRSRADDSNSLNGTRDRRVFIQ